MSPRNVSVYTRVDEMLLLSCFARLQFKVKGFEFKAGKEQAFFNQLFPAVTQ